MTPKRPLFWSGLAAVAVAAALAGCAALHSSYELPAAHPDELEPGPPVCSDCHEPDGGPVAYARFDHTPAFAAGAHRLAAGQKEAVCSLCHQPSLCNGCHADAVELKPSARDPGGTRRAYPHRGDYLTRHRIDGRVDPASCFRCHGNPKASASCRPCHGR